MAKLWETKLIQTDEFFDSGMIMLFVIRKIP